MFFRIKKISHILNIDVIIQARMDSSRLPGKIMMNLDNNSVLDYVITQLKCSKMINRIIIATTHDSVDDVIIKYAQERGLTYFRGDKNDVLDRYYKCAKEFGCKNIVRITSDCPLIDPKTVDKIIQKFFSLNVDYATNKLPLKFSKCPHGAEVEIFSFETLKTVWNKSKKRSEREHVTPYIYNNSEKFKIFNLDYDKDLSYMRYTIDRPKDLELVQKIVTKIKTRPILTEEIVQLFIKEPNLLSINSEYKRNEGYFKSIKDEE